MIDIFSWKEFIEGRGEIKEKSCLNCSLFTTCKFTREPYSRTSSDSSSFVDDIAKFALDWFSCFGENCRFYSEERT